jgi:hypothetical protein
MPEINPVSCEWRESQVLDRASVLDDHSSRAPFLKEECELVRTELRAIVSSPYFRNSKRYPAFLSYIVEKTLQGEGSEIKERTIGIEVFGRPADYDTNSDPAVRNTASEVRKRLSLYHSEATNSTPVRIYLPLGSYHPELRFESEASSTLKSVFPDPLGISEPGIPAETSTPSQVAQKSRFKWFLWAVPLLGLLVGGGLWGLILHLQQTPLEKLWIGFFNPSQPVLIGIPQAPAPAMSDGPFMAGPLKKEDLPNWIKDNPDVAAEDVSAIMHASKPLMEHDVAYRIEMDSSITLTDLRDRPVVLIGGPSNLWATKLLAPLRFHFSSADSLYVEDSQNPQSRQWSYTLGKAAGPGSHLTVLEDCAIVARFTDPTTGGVVMVIAGAGRNGTEAAGEFVASNELLGELDKRLPAGWKNKNLEVVLKTKVIDGKTGSPSIEATYLW